MAFGVETSGFVKKALADILQDIQEFQLDNISSQLNLLATSVLGQLNGVFADKLREMWDVSESVYRSFYPDSATGDALDGIAAITGVTRLQPTSSTVTFDQLFLGPGTTVPVGAVVSIGATGERFATTAAVTNSLGYTATFSATAESENTGLIAGFAGTLDTIQTPISGWGDKAELTAGAAETYSLDGLSLTLKADRGSTQTINFAAGNPWTAAGAGLTINGATTGVNGYDDGNGVLRIQSTTSGTGSSMEITGGSANAVLLFDTDEVKGFNSTDATEGTNLETDAALRIRRDNLIRGQGSATVEAIRARLLQVTDVTTVFVIENTTDATVDTLPPHSFESIVLGGVNQTIADAIWANKPAGIETHGSVSETVEDSMSINHTIKFSRPSSIRIHMAYTLNKTSAYPATGDALVKAAAVTLMDTLIVGDDVIALSFKSVALDIAGVADVTAFTLWKDGDSPGTINLPIATRELATLDTGDIAVT